jgi:hypothetical protein
MLLRFIVKVMQAMGNRFVALSTIALLYDQTCTSLDIMKFSKHSVPKHPITIIKNDPSIKNISVMKHCV